MLIGADGYANTTMASVFYLDSWVWNMFLDLNIIAYLSFWKIKYFVLFYSIFSAKNSKLNPLT